MGSIVETNCVFTNNIVKPIVANPLPAGALTLVERNCRNLSFDEAKELFTKMCDNAAEYLKPYYPNFK